MSDYERLFLGCACIGVPCINLLVFLFGIAISHRRETGKKAVSLPVDELPQTET